MNTLKLLNRFSRLASLCGVRWLVCVALLFALPNCSRAAIQAYVQFIPATNSPPIGDSTDTNYPASQGWFELPSMDISVLQVLNIGSTGAGAGKITFNPLAIQKMLDAYSPVLFERACAGNHYKFVNMVFCRPEGTGGRLFNFFKITLGLVGIKTQGWSFSSGTTNMTENLTFEYGAMALTYIPQNADGTPGTPVTEGWDRVYNVPWIGTTLP